MLALCSLIILLDSRSFITNEDEAKGTKIESSIYTRPYFEKNNSGLKGELSVGVITDRATFDKTFGVGFVMGKKPEMVAADAFEKRVVLYVIKRGMALYEYKNATVTADKGVLTVHFTSVGKGAGGTARYASSLIISIAQGAYKTVDFFEDGKKIGSVPYQKK